MATAAPGGGSASAAAQRSQQHFLEVLGLPSSMVQLPSVLHVIQTHKENEQNSHDWTLRVESPPGYPLAASEFVESVTYELHPTFKPSVVTVKEAPFQLARRGWGTFSVLIQITFQPGWGDASNKPLVVQHMLDFDSAISQTRVDVPRMRMDGGFLARVQAGTALRPVQTRVRTLDGQEYTEQVGPVSRAMGAAAGVGTAAAAPTRAAEAKGAEPLLPLTPLKDLPSLTRGQMLAQLKRAPELEPTNTLTDPTWHGRGIVGSLPPPQVTWESNRKPREDKHGADNAGAWLTASEYRDHDAVLAVKVQLLAQLLQVSKHTLAYTGAGLSVAAGIAQAATGSASFRRHVSVEADPTVAHCVLAKLNGRGLLHSWVQQNHDGLPQKAGYRQEDINEIHGSWYDCSNPVVKYSGSLRDDLCQDMFHVARTADLVLVLGTSLSGLNADQCVEKTANRSLFEKALGSVIISPQRTPQDGAATLRIFATADEVMTALAHLLGIVIPQGNRRAVFSKECRVRVPYDRHGRHSETVTTVWDLRPGALVHVNEFNNIQGAQQPAYMKISHKSVGKVVGRNDKTCAIDLAFDAGVTRMKLGVWWVEAAVRGGPQYLPVVNVDAREEPVKP